MIRTIGDAVREAVATSGMDTLRFAQNVGINRTTLYAYMNGTRIPRADTLLEIAKTTSDPARWMASLLQEGA